MCKKVKHRTKGAAYLVWRKTGQNVQLDVYYCKCCKAYHLGNSNKPHRRVARINQLLDKVLKN